MKRLAVLALAGALLVPAATAAQSDGPDDFAEILEFTGIAGEPTLGELMSSGSPSSETRQAVRDEIARQREALLSVDPSECWLNIYLGYWDFLTLADASMVIFDTDLAASTDLLEMSTEKMQSLNVSALGDCMSA